MNRKRHKQPNKISSLSTVHCLPPRPTFLMCRPTYFRIAYEINPWMRVKRQSKHTKAKRQWQRLYDVLRSAGARVTLMPPVKAQPDLVFTANAGIVTGRSLILSNFRYPERQGEVPHIERWCRRQRLRIQRLPADLRFEGEGDALRMGKRLFFGYHFRSEVRAHQHIGRLMRLPVISLELRDPAFYHLDTCFRPLSEQCAMYYPPAFDRYAQRVLKRYVKDSIIVGKQEARKFVCNAVPVGDQLIIPRGLTQRTCTALQQRGWRITELEFSEFQKAGGAAKCLVLRLSSAR